MLKVSFFTTVFLAASAALTSHAGALPVCYMDLNGVVTDLSHMCGGESGSGVTTVAPFSPQLPILQADVWTRNIHFSNVSCSSGECFETASITGNIHNSGPVVAENVEIEAVGYAEGRAAQTRRVVVPSIGPGDAREVTISFGFSVLVDSWDVNVISWD